MVSNLTTKPNQLIKIESRPRVTYLISCQAFRSSSCQFIEAEAMRSKLIPSNRHTLDCSQIRALGTTSKLWPKDSEILLVDNLEARNTYWSQVQSTPVNNQTLSGGTFYTGKRLLWCLTARLTGDHPSSTTSSTITISQAKSKMTSFIFMALLCVISWRSSYGLQFNSSQGENIIPGKRQQILTG